MDGNVQRESILEDVLSDEQLKVAMQDAKVGKRSICLHSISEKMDAIIRVRAGESKASVARKIGLPESTLRGWCKNEPKIRASWNASLNITERVVNPNGNITSSEDDNLARPGPSKRRRMDNAYAFPSSSSYDTENTDIVSRIDHINTFMYNSIWNNSILPQQNALQSNGITNGLVPQTVGLDENGLQYSKNNNGHSNKRHSLATASHYSAIAPTTQMDSKATRKSLPAAAEAPATPVPASPRKTNKQCSASAGTSQLNAGAGSSSGRSNPTPAHQQQTTSTPLTLRPPTKIKADRVLYGNNNNNYNNHDDETAENGAHRPLDLSNKTAEGETATEPSEAAGSHNMTRGEAIIHGRKFLAWVENSSDLATTELSICEIKVLLTKLVMESPTRK